MKYKTTTVKKITFWFAKEELRHSTIFQGIGAIYWAGQQENVHFLQIVADAGFFCLLNLECTPEIV